MPAAAKPYPLSPPHKGSQAQQIVVRSRSNASQSEQASHYFDTKYLAQHVALGRAGQLHGWPWHGRQAANCRMQSRLAFAQHMLRQIIPCKMHPCCWYVAPAALALSLRSMLAPPCPQQSAAAAINDLVMTRSFCRAAAPAQAAAAWLNRHPRIHLCSPTRASCRRSPDCRARLHWLSRFILCSSSAALSTRAPLGHGSASPRQISPAQRSPAWAAAAGHSPAGSAQFSSLSSPTRLSPVQQPQPQPQSSGVSAASATSTASVWCNGQLRGSVEG